MFWKLKILLLFFLISGCSGIEKSLFMKSIDEKGNWEFEKSKKNHNFIGFKTSIYHFNKYQYYSCDSNSFVSVSFSNKPNLIFWGPPLIPIFPMAITPYYWKIYRDKSDFTIQINIETNDSIVIDSLLNHIRFFVNDSINSTILLNTKTIKNDLKKGSQLKHLLCNNGNLSASYSAFFKFKKKPDKFKKLKISFDDEFNKKLSSNYQTLILKKRYKIYYRFLYIPL